MKKTRKNDPEEAKKIDANDLLKDWQSNGLELDEQRSKANSLLILAKPLITIAAERAGELSEDDRADGIKDVVALLKSMSEDERGYWIRRTAKLMKVGVSNLQELIKPSKNGKKGKDDDDGEPIFTAGGWIQHHLVEIFYKPDERKTYFAVRYPDGRISELMERATIEGQKYIPIPPNSTIVKRTILLPSELGEEKSEDELLAMTRIHINRYFDFGGNDFFREVSPLYVPFSYIYDAFMEVSYLRGLGDYGTGKTRFLKTIGKICYRPVYMSGGSSAASIYHLLDTFRGTLVLNEGDFTQSDESSIIAKILNGGTERDESVTKMRGSMENMTVESYNVFGPKVIATRKEFNDHAIRSRCLTMDMLPMAPNPRIPQSLPPEKEHQDLYLRNLWTMFRMKNAQENIKVDESQIDRSLEPRLNQITLSLLATIKSEETKEKIRDFLREYNERTRGDRYEMFTARVLEGTIIAWAWDAVSERPEDEFRVYMKDIALAINMVIDHQKTLMGEDDEADDEEHREEKKADERKAIKTKSRKVSDVYQKYLNIRTIRSKDGLKEYKGTKYVNMADEQERIKALCLRWGVEWRERGSLGENAEVKEDDIWMKRQKTIMIDFNRSSDGSKKARKEWYGHENGSLGLRGEDE